MIEKTSSVKIYEQADAFLDEFRDSVRQAQRHAHEAGVDYTFVVNGRSYIARPNGNIDQQETMSVKSESQIETD